MDCNQIRKAIKMTRNSRGLVLQGPQSTPKSHQSHLSIYLNHLSTYFINKKAFKHTWIKWKIYFHQNSAKLFVKTSLSMQSIHVGAKSDQQVNICSFAARCDRIWPSTQWHRIYTGSGNRPGSSWGRSVTLFQNVGARSLLWGYKWIGMRRGC